VSILDNDVLKQCALDYHEFPVPGKLSVHITKPTNSQNDLSLAYTPGVAAPVLAIAENAECAYRYTNKGNLVAVMTNGTAVLGLGDLGPLASKPVMEGKAVLFKRFADIDVYDIEIDAYDPQAFIGTAKRIPATVTAKIRRCGSSKSGISVTTSVIGWRLITATPLYAFSPANTMWYPLSINRSES
jgi:malic enzyme